jgi:hypothetical protein
MKRNHKKTKTARSSRTIKDKIIINVDDIKVLYQQSLKCGNITNIHFLSVIPAKAGIQNEKKGMDSRLHGNDNTKK